MSLAQEVVGIDYVPTHPPDFHLAKSSATIFDAIKYRNELWVLFWQGSSSSMKITTYRFDEGELDTGAATVLTVDTTSGSLEAGGAGGGFQGAAMDLCTPQTAEDEALSEDGGRWYLPDIGVVPGAISLTGTGGPGCAPSVSPSSFEDGYKYGGSTTTDSVVLTGTTGCTSITATYTYTNCSLANPYHCPMHPDVDPDSNPATVELGYCKFLMLYDGVVDNDTGAAAPDNHHLFLAHAQEPDATWVRYLDYSAGSDPYPVADDIIVENRSPHTSLSGTDWAEDVFSMTGVPDLLWDPGDEVWRLWFVTNHQDEAWVAYTESATDGLTWGITGADHGIDCWDVAGSAWDTDNCTVLAWASTHEPPDWPTNGTGGDIVDPHFYRVDYQGDTAEELIMAFAGSDRECEASARGNPEMQVVLEAVHEAMGDQSGGDKWTWIESLANDTADGVLFDEDTAACDGDDASYMNGDDNVGDPTVVKWAGGANPKYVIFFQLDGGIHVAGSGFECSDFVDNGDADTDADYPVDGTCMSPTGGSEG